MKILLFGEFSGFMNSLKHGLTTLGHEVFIASNGDYYKDYPADFRWDSHFSKKLGKFQHVYNACNVMLHNGIFKGYDVVLLQSFDIIPFCTRQIYEFLIKHNKLVYLSGCGSSPRVSDFWYDSTTKYHNYFAGALMDGGGKNLHRPNKRKWEDELLSKVDGYIPTWYEYAEPFRNERALRPAIRVPVQIDLFEYQPNRVKDGKVVFYHGKNGERKGTRFIQEAFEKLRDRHKNNAEFIIADRLPFDQYMQVVNKTNVIVDDANSYSVAMNGLFNMLKGKVIMGGAEPEGDKELGIEGVNPVFNINPDVQQICETIEYIIEHKNQLEEWGIQGRRFVEEYHDSVKIAQQYLDLWNKDLRDKK